MLYRHAMGRSWFDAGAEAMDIFGLRAREARKTAKEQGKLQLSEQAQTFEQQRVLTRDERESEAVENFRAKIVGKIKEIERSALAAAAQMEKARKLANTTELEGDPVLGDVEAQIADMERAVVQIQAGTVVDTATFDTHKLAVSYSDAQAALVAMNAVRNRAKGVVQALEERIAQVKKEQIRAEQFRAEQRARAAAEERRRVQFARQEEDRRRREASAQANAERLRAMQAALELDRRISVERRAVMRLRQEIASARQAQERRKVNAAALQARRAKLAAMRTGA